MVKKYLEIKMKEEAITLIAMTRNTTKMGRVERMQQMMTYLKEYIFNKGIG